MSSLYVELQSTSPTAGFNPHFERPAEVRHEVTMTAPPAPEGEKFDWSLDTRSSTVDHSTVTEHELTRQLKHDPRYAQGLRRERAQLLRGATSVQALEPAAARRVRLLDWMLDRAEMAAMNDDLDRLEKVATAYEELAEQVRSLTEAVSVPRRAADRRSR